MKMKNSNCIILAFVTIVEVLKKTRQITGKTKRNPVVLKDSKSRAMSAEMLKCQVKCKAEGKSAMLP
jgi:hypothetical protein